ncbi:c-type cytochrome [Maribacter litopenaei]|uniref:C-type cytochrome n=1 Tax=Maribacter litopenaei TaxID=2976127 RepID=A0ABY5Y569_9FLAO|nr:c-type cytochrome [Maribacter litopenaei]UWX54177.1 c-type cytochrome [Maribacter litopenaei]
MNKFLLQFIAIVAMVAITGACNSESGSNAGEQDSEIKFNIPEGFYLEEIYHPSAYEQGSWVALAQGPEGVVYSCDQYGKIYSFTPPKTGEELSKKDVTPLDIEIGQAHGLLWAFNSLYVSVNKRWDEDSSFGSGIYRIEDTDGDGVLDQSNMLLKLQGDGEHGPHSMVLSPDGMEIYFIAGNHTLVPDILKNNSRLPNNWNEDNLITPYLDARGHANDIKAPGGWVAKFNPEGTEWELISAGYRNPFDIAFNKDGELFTYDSDMEWDIGMPWYRPTRICHVVPGSEYGWRTGSGKWPAYYPDNLPAVHNLEQGSPTAVLSAATLNFPAKYKNGLLVMDWSFGTVYFIDLIPKGSSYEAKREQFFSGTPLPLTDMISGSDGNLYFATGGRNPDSHLYRLTYTGDVGADADIADNDKNKQLRELRHSLESFQKNTTEEGLSLAWDNLYHEDRFIRYASRMVLEHASFEDWRDRYLTETDPLKLINASVAIARTDNTQNQQFIHQKLNSINLDKLNNEDQLAYLRAYSLSFIRMGKPMPATSEKIANKLNQYFPNTNNSVNKELGQLLLFLEADGITEGLVNQLIKHTEEKTVSEGVELLDEETTLRSEQYGEVIREVIAKMPPSEAIYYGMLLSNAEKGWTKELREKYFSWFYDVLGSKGGMSFKAYMENVRQRAMSHVPESEKEYFKEISGEYSPSDAVADLPQPEGPGGIYTAGDLQDIIYNEEVKGGSYEDGKRAFEAAMCILCHRMRGEGGAAGSDLTQAHTKFGTGDLILSIASPNDEISDQYAHTLFVLKDGKNLAGRVKSENEDEIVLMPNPFNETYTVNIRKEDVEERGISPISPMPGGLLNRLNEQEIKDLFKYLQSGGDENHESYK